MKKLFLVAVLLLMPQIQNAMEEKRGSVDDLENLSIGDEKLTQEDAEKLYWASGPAYDQQTIPYGKYKTDLKKAIPFLNYTQHHYHNPLINAVAEGDYDFAKFLLEHGASPTFRGMNNINGFDALSLINSKIYYNPDAVKRFKGLLDDYMKPGEQRTPYPLAGVNANYSPNRALDN